MLKILEQPKPISLIKDESLINSLYKRFRFQVFLGIYIGYAGFYVVRNNTSLVSNQLLDEGITKGELGFIGNCLLVSYGLSKFFSGILADKSNSKMILPLGLFLSGIVNICIGLTPSLASNVLLFSSIMFINGIFQGMGWAPCGRVIVNWFSTTERGQKMSFWNTAHNVGAAVAAGTVAIGLQIANQKWVGGFLIPGIFSIAIAILVYFLVIDNPSSIGLPIIQDFKNDPEKIEIKQEELDKKDIAKYLFTSKLVLLLAITNIFVYTLRYGVLSWIPVYLKETFGASVNDGLAGFGLFEIAGIFGTILCGYISDKFFNSNRSKPAIIFSVIVTVFLILYAFAPSNTPTAVLFIFIAVIGGAIYGPVMVIGLQAIDLSPKNLAGTSAGFTGLFGYILGATLASSITGSIVDNFGWNIAFTFMIIISLLSIIGFLFINSIEKNIEQNRRIANETNT